MKHGAQYLRAGKVSLDTDEHNQKLRSVALLSPYRPGLVEAGPWEAGGWHVSNRTAPSGHKTRATFRLKPLATPPTPASLSQALMTMPQRTGSSVRARFSPHNSARLEEAGQKASLCGSPVSRGSECSGFSVSAPAGDPSE